MKLKSVFLFLKIISNIILLRPFGNIIHDITQKYEEISLQELRKYEKLRVKINKARLDITFLKNCQTFNVTPKFLIFKLPPQHNGDIKFIQKHLLKSAILRRNKEMVKLEIDLQRTTQNIRSNLSALDFYILQSATRKNVLATEKHLIRKHEKKLQNLTKNRVTPFKSEDTIINRSSYKCTKEELDILKHGLDYAIPPRFVNKTDVYATFEVIYRVLKKDLKHEKDSGEIKSQLSYLASSYVNGYKPTKNTLEKHKILKKLRTNKDIIITRPDKGNGIVILDRKEYINMMHDIIKDTTKFKLLNNDMTLSRESKLKRFLLSLKKKGFFNISDYDKIYPSGSTVARAYGLPKMHKLNSSNDKLKLRPIISSINTYNYELSSFLAKLLDPCINKKYCAQDTFSFVRDINKVSSSNKFMVSYDVTSLFTNIPLDETIKIAVDLILEKNSKIKITKRELTKLFYFATSESHFLFNGQYYDQINGVAMGSPIAPVLANLFMSHFENKWIKEYKNHQIFFYQRYVDGIFCMMENEAAANDFLSFLNTKHTDIKFTMETQNNNSLPFLDVLITSTENNLITSIYRKKTFTGLFLCFTSFTPYKYKLGLIKTLIDRAFKICHNWSIFHNDLIKIKELLIKNNFPLNVINKTVKKYIDNIHNKSISKTVDDKDISYLKLPYVGKFSKYTQQKINRLCKKFCKNTNIQLVFSPCKISNFFSSKDIIPHVLKSSVVYKYTCANCQIGYVGETYRHLHERVKEHLTQKSSHIFKHLEENPLCKQKSDISCFQIIDNDNSVFRLKIKEALHINWTKPELNKQVKHLAVSISV